MRAIMFACALAASASPSYAGPHPNYERYEYLVEDFYGSEPSDPEKRNWECYDDEVDASLSCVFIRGSLSRFRYIYRLKRIPQIPRTACWDLRLESTKFRYEIARIEAAVRGAETCKEELSAAYNQLPFFKMELDNARKLASAGCDRDNSSVEYRSFELQHHREYIGTLEEICREEVREQRREARDRARTESEDENELEIESSGGSSFPTYIPPMSTPGGTFDSGGSRLTGRKFGDDPGLDNPNSQVRPAR
jgi:hypothetical protein